MHLYYMCNVHSVLKIVFYFKGRMPGTTKWKPVNENPEAQEDVHGALIVRLRDNLDFGKPV